jgi:hypothetical protein
MPSTPSARGSCMQRGTFAGCSAMNQFSTAKSRAADSRCGHGWAYSSAPSHPQGSVLQKSADRSRTLCERSFLLLLPAPGERLRGGLPARLVTMRPRAIFVLTVGERPHPGRPWRRRDGLEDAPDNKSARTDDVVVVGAALFTPGSALSSSSEQKVGHRSPLSSTR